MKKTKENIGQEAAQQEAESTNVENGNGMDQEKEQEQKKGKKAVKDESTEKIAELSDKLAKEHDDYLRLMAEFETFRRRSSEDRLNLIASASADTIKGLLPVLDDCERALEVLEKSSDEAAKEGTNLIYTKLMSYLGTKGLKKIEAMGADFDTDFHEAVTQFPAPTEDMKGKVIDVVQTGYTLSGKVLRYAKVVVGA